MTTKKITFRVPQKLWASFTVQTKRVFINRAPFLDHMIAHEVPYVTSDLSDFKLSPKARRYIGGALTKADAKPVNIEIRKETAEALDEIVVKHGLVRDALLCRLLIFLRGSDVLFKYLEIPTEAGESVRRSTLLQGMPASPMKAIEEVFSDPLFYIRSNLQDGWGCGVYNVALPRTLDWAACLLEDRDVPGTKANKEMMQNFLEMDAAFEREEEALFNSSTPATTGAKK